jgi:hypothetical protein
VIELILRKYTKVFCEKVSNEFKGTNLMENQIITGDSKPIRKAPSWVPFVLWKEMEAQVQDMLKKGVIEPSMSSSSGAHTKEI